MRISPIAASTSRRRPHAIMRAALPPSAPTHIVEDRSMQAPAPESPPPATWARANKHMIGCALHRPRVWFTAAAGMLTEVFHPRIDIPQLKLLNFIVADDAGFWYELGEPGSYTIEEPMVGVPALTIHHRHPRFKLTLRICPDPDRDVVLLDVHLEGDSALRPYACLLPRVGEDAEHNLAAVGMSGRRRALLAWQGPFGVALLAADAEGDEAWRRLSVGHVEASDLRTDFERHGRMALNYDEAGPGQLMLAGELPPRATLALGFCTSADAAATLAHSALLNPFEHAWDAHIRQWRGWLAQIIPPEGLASGLWPQLLRSAMVLKTHKDHTFTGAMVASLSTPWGHVSSQRGGYHLVWARDLVESAGAFFALALPGEAREVLRYLIATQQPDGHWHQNQWLGGKPYWHGVQLDEAAFPVLLAALLAERDALGGIEVTDMVQRALGFIARTGPASDQDRWEEDAGVNPFTLAVCIAALVAGANFVDSTTREFLLALADDWNARIEDFTAVSDTALARRVGVAGYYVRIAPSAVFSDNQALHRRVPIRNRLQESAPPADEQVSTDALQLVRFGLRDANDPLVRDTVAVIDALLRVDLPTGAAWRRYNGDGYGEHEDGAPFDGSGCGRPWPLLAGERGHYKLLAGRDPMPCLRAMAAMASGGGMLPEQVWDGEAIPARGLFPGRPTGSAMPLAWAHAEFVKLALSCHGERPCDCPASVWERYRAQRPVPCRSVWLAHAPMSRGIAGIDSLVCLHEPALVHWGVDGWHDTADVPTQALPALGLHVAHLPTARRCAGQAVDFTWRLRASGEWIGKDYRLLLVSANTATGA
jgi:glucoamylase